MDLSVEINSINN